MKPLSLKTKEVRHTPHFFYAHDFELEAHQSEVAGKEPRYSLADISRAEERGRAAGLAEATCTTDAQQQQQRAALLDSVKIAVEGARDAADDMTSCVVTELVQTLLAMTATLLPAHCASHGAGEVIAMVKRLAPALRLEPKIVIRVQEAMLAEVEATLLALAPELRRSMELSPLLNAAPGDVQIAWKDGFASRTVSELEMHLLNTLEELGLARHGETSVTDLSASRDRSVTSIRSLAIANARG